MKILFLDAYFNPELIAFTHLENDLIAGLIAAGHKVKIICPIPTRGVTPEIIKHYKKRKTEQLYGGKVEVVRYFAPQEGKHPIARALRYFWCNFRTYQLGKKEKCIDAVFANSTPPTQGWIAGKVAAKLKVPFVFSLQDVFPDSLVTSGLTTTDSLLFKLGRRIEIATYKKCNYIVTISTSIKDNLKSKGVPENKLALISNWIDTCSIKPISRNSNSLFDDLNVSRDKFIVVYAGNFGAAQGADIILKAAKILQNEHHIHFVIFGGGAEFSQACRIAKGLKNVTLNSLLPQDRISDVYSMGDVALITCKRGTGTNSMPSKTWSIMACNTPIIASFDKHGELENLLLSAQAGICIEPENSTLLADSIRLQALISSPKIMTSRDFVIRNASREICVKKYIELFERSEATDE